jgi:fructosamine-3-kinase
MSNTSFPLETYTLLNELLREMFGSTTKLASYKILNQHPDYYALLVTLDHASIEIVVKLAGADAPYLYPFDRTAMFHRLVAEKTSIPMPEILAVDVSYERYPWRYLIKTYLPGEEWSTLIPKLTTSERVDAYQQLGNAVGKLHRIQFETFGEVDSSGNVSIATEYLSALTNYIYARIKNPDHQEMLLNCISKRADLFHGVEQARLCHEDLHRHNILLRHTNGRWQLATILDFDKAWAGHYEIDLAKLELWTDMTGEGFWEAYNRVMSVDAGYPERRPIYQLLWCLEYAANTPQHLSDTRNLCDQLDLPIIDRFI